MKTPDEIKKGLGICVSDEKCHSCPYKIEECDGLLADALAYIRHLEAKVPKWISAEERLPEPDTSVLVYQTSPNKVINFIAIGHIEEDEECDGNFAWVAFGSPGNTVTHWMPLPEPPEV